MKVWQLNSTKSIEHTTAPNPAVKSDSAKIKITKALLSDSDYETYLGGKASKYPLVLGRYAIGIATEVGEDSYIHKNDRVYLSDVIDDDNAESGILVAGETMDGYYKDFTVANSESAYILPHTLPDESAFLIDAAAIAERVISEAHIKTGDHILVVGGGIYSNVFCQLLVYHRAVPILIDNNQARLDRARKSGIYYTYHNDEQLRANINLATGGKLCEGAVYFAFANKSDATLFLPMLQRDACMCFVAHSQKSLNINLSNALKSNLTLRCFTDAKEYIPTAINVLANKAITTKEYKFNLFPEKQLADKFASLTEETAQDLSEELNIFKFVI